MTSIASVAEAMLVIFFQSPKQHWRAITKTMKVIVVLYDSNWPLEFEKLLALLLPALPGELIESIEHVGSTSVPGLAAKPIVDIDIVIPSQIELPKVIAALARLGYEHRGNLGVEDREAFRKPCIGKSSCASKRVTCGQQTSR